MSNNRIPENHESSNLYYLEQKKREAVQINFDNKKYFQNLHIVELQPYTPDKYYDTQKDWSEMEAFKEQKKKYTNQNAGISFTLRVKSFFNNVAKTELEIKKKQADVMYEADKKIALEYYNKRATRFYEKRKQQHDDINKLHEMMQYGNVEQVIAYFTFVLQQDNYSTDVDNQFHVDIADMRYEPKSKKLCFAYRIPNKEEILTFSSFLYDPESDSIQPKPIDAKHQLIQRKHIMHRVLLRSLIMVYESDKYSLVDDVEIIGFFKYYDPSYGTNRRKDVINFHMSRDEYVQTDFEKVNVEALFSARLKIKESAGIYVKKEEEIFDIYTVKGKVNSNAKIRKRQK